MGRRSGDDTSSSWEDQDWELEQPKKVAAKFPRIDTEELAAELAATLIALKRRRPPGIRGWKAYVSKALFNRASRFAKEWRAQQRRETSIELNTEMVEKVSRSEADSRRPEAHLKLSRIRRRLDAESYALLKLLADSEENKSRVARLLGKHRNTIRRRLQKIRRALVQCPIENVSGHAAPVQNQPKQRLQLTAKQEEQLARMVRNWRACEAFKARLILALASGQSYTQIQRTLKTTAPTISRWRRRFETNGIEGLRAKHQGRKLPPQMRILIVNWFRSARLARKLRTRLSCRKMARKLGLSKSTAHRILNASRLHPES